MYTLVNAFAVRNTPQAHWGAVSLGATLISQIYQNYRKVYLTLSNPVLPDNVYVDMEDMRLQYQGYQGTLNQLLASIGSLSLPTTETIPTPNPKYVRYADAFNANYKCELVAENGADVPTTLERRVMLRMSRKDTDMRTFYKNCLVSINGFFHLTDTDGTYAYVVDAGKSSLKSRQNQVGILNFMDLGELEIIPITEEMIYAQDETGKLSERTYLKLPDAVDLTDKVPMLVMGGYLNFLGSSFFQSGDNTFALDFHEMRLLSRFYESLPYNDFSFLGLTGTDLNKEQVQLAQFFSNEVLIKYMTCAMSFVVLVKTPSLFTNKIYLRHAKLPGMFVSETQPRYPLVYGFGRTAEYWKTYEDKQWSITVQDNLLNHRVFEYSNPSELNSASDQRVPYNRTDFSKGYFLEIGKDF